MKIVATISDNLISTNNMPSIEVPGARSIMKFSEADTLLLLSPELMSRKHLPRRCLLVALRWATANALHFSILFVMVL